MADFLHPVNWGNVQAVTNRFIEEPVHLPGSKLQKAPPKTASFSNLNGQLRTSAAQQFGARAARVQQRTSNQQQRTAGQQAAARTTATRQSTQAGRMNQMSARFAQAGDTAHAKRVVNLTNTMTPPGAQAPAPAPRAAGRRAAPAAPAASSGAPMPTFQAPTSEADVAKVLKNHNAPTNPAFLEARQFSASTPPRSPAHVLSGETAQPFFDNTPYAEKTASQGSTASPFGAPPRGNVIQQPPMSTPRNVPFLSPTGARPPSVQPNAMAAPLTEFEREKIDVHGAEYLNSTLFSSHPRYKNTR